MKLKLGALLLLVAALVLWLVWKSRDSAQGSPLLDAVSQAASPEAIHGSSAAAALSPHDSSAPRSTAALPEGSLELSDPATVPAPKPPTLVNGRVLDLTGTPLEGVRVTLRDRASSTSAVSAAGGRFEFPLPDPPILNLGMELLELQVAPEQRWASACGTPFTRERCTDLLLVAARSIEIGGVVENEAGLPVEGAKVRLTVRSTQLREFPLQLDRAAPLELSTTSTASGSFYLSSVPAVASCTLRADFEESLRGEVELPVETALDLRIILRGTTLEANSVFTGVVHGFEGRAVEGATVMLGNSSTKSMADGHFELPLPEWIPEGLPLVAVKQGFQPAIASDIADRIAHKDFSPLFLRLGPATLEIRGRVLLSDGKPARGWTVMLADGTEVTRGTVPPTTAEGLATGSSRGTKTGSTDSSGEFTLAGLSPRMYTVRAWNDKTLLSLRASGVAAGTLDLVLRVPSDATWTEVHGVVVDRRAVAVAKVQIGVELITFQSGGAESWQSGVVVSTESDGRFILKDVPKSDVRLSISGDSVIGRSVDVSLLQMQSELRLEVDLRCHFRLVSGRTQGAPDRAHVLDANGTRLSIFTYHDRGWSSSVDIWIHGASTTHAMAVSERAQTLVLFLEDKEIERIPMTLLPGQVTDVRF